MSDDEGGHWNIDLRTFVFCGKHGNKGVESAVAAIKIASIK